MGSVHQTPRLVDTVTPRNHTKWLEILGERASQRAKHLSIQFWLSLEARALLKDSALRNQVRDSRQLLVCLNQRPRIRVVVSVALVGQLLRDSELFDADVPSFDWTPRSGR